jgi:hypothetical protein
MDFEIVGEIADVETFAEGCALRTKTGARSAPYMVFLTVGQARRPHGEM